MYQIMKTDNNVECHLCTHRQGFYGNLFIWFFNLHQEFLDAPLRPRRTIKNELHKDYNVKTADIEDFHFRPDDYHKWCIQEKSWNEHIQSIIDEQANVDWRPTKHFTKLVVKTNIHALHKLAELNLLTKANPKVIYNLTVDINNIEFLNKIANRLDTLNNTNSQSLTSVQEQHQYANQALKQILTTYTICNVDVHKLFFEYDDAEYKKILKMLGTDPIDNWQYKIIHAKELINED